MRWLLVAWIAFATAVASAAPAFTVDVSGRGRAVILIPGLGCPGTVWKQTADHLAKTHEVHVLHLAGFAGNPVADRTIPSAVKDDVIAYIIERALDKPIVVGHSMGGWVALWIAEEASDLIGGVVVVDSGPSLGGGDPDMLPYARAKREAYKTMASDKFEATIRERFGAMFTDPTKREHDAILAAVARSDQRAYADALWEISTIDLRPQLAKITAPTLLLLAASKPPTAREEKLVKSISNQMKPVKGHEVVVVPATKHFIMQDDFAGFAKAIDRFLVAHP